MESMRGAADHSRARVVSRNTTGSKVRLHFCRRVLRKGDDGMSSAPPRFLFDREYATTDDDRELLTTEEGIPQDQNRWEVGCVLCRVEMEQLGGGRCAPLLAAQQRVDAVLTDLNAGMTLDDAVRKHVAS